MALDPTNPERRVDMATVNEPESTPDTPAVPATPIPKLKGRQRIFQGLQRISSSPSLARLGRKAPSSYRSGTKGSISCVSLSSSSTLSSPYRHPSANASATATAPGASSGLDAHFFDPSRSRSGIRLIEAELVAAEATTPTTCPVPARLRSSSRCPQLAATPEDVQASHEATTEPVAATAATVVTARAGRENFHFWAHMPVEIKTRIFRCLEPKEIVRCSTVCRAWHRLCFDGQLWKSVDASAFYRDIPGSSLAKIITSAGPFVRDLNLRGCIQMHDGANASQLSKACPNLEYVSLEGSHIDGSSVLYLLHRNPRLAHLNLTGLAAVSNVACKIIGQHCPLLTDLNVSWCANVDARGLRKIVDGCPFLADLRVSEIRGLDDETLMASLFARNRLRRLVLHGCTSLTDRALATLLHGPDPDICPLLNRALVPPRLLRHLDLSRCQRLTDAGVETLAHHVPALEGLQLAGCVELTDAALLALLPTVPRLTHLDLEDLPQLTNATLQALAAAPCRAHLQHLSISSCELLGDAGMIPVLQACRHLASVDLDNTRVGDLVLIEAASMVRQRSRLCAAPHRPRVGLRLVVYDCQHVTWTGIREVLSGNADVTRPAARPAATSSASSAWYPTEIIQLKCFYGWQMTVEEHTKRVLRGDLAAAARLERRWAEYMMTNEEAGVAGAGGRRRRRRAREAAMMHADEEGAEGGAGGVGGRRRRARSGGCLVM
ncbi:MAG: hypothetical protein M1826_001239 [Phylliscum demangeonii]|nr:MAG: hypothetical protein M1826_001239 [Phylliscum demangeonii]